MTADLTPIVWILAACALLTTALTGAAVAAVESLVERRKRRFAAHAKDAVHAGDGRTMPALDDILEQPYPIGVSLYLAAAAGEEAVVAREVAAEHELLRREVLRLRHHQPARDRSRR